MTGPVRRLHLRVCINPLSGGRLRPPPDGRGSIESKRAVPGSGSSRGCPIAGIVSIRTGSPKRFAGGRRGVVEV